jgi:paraquat-inducible protein B
MNEMKPSVSSSRKLSAVWIIPLVAVVIGVWMVVHTAMTEGPTITIDFKTAEGLEAGKTKVRILSHEIGLVEEVLLKEDVSGVTATVKLEPQARPLLREDTRFWVVRARVGAGGISGLGTLLSGAYIEMAPGTATEGRKAFIGLEVPPLTPVGAPGLRLNLFSDRAGSVSTGNAVLFQGYEVGRVEATVFDTDRQQVRYDIFIDAPFHELVHSATRFWDISGVAVNASASGIQVNTGSVETILLGGVSFATPPGVPAGNPVADGAEFKLYGSYSDILENPYKHGTHYVVSFRQSLRGLLPGAPVEYRGIQVGRVERILLEELTASGLAADRTNVPIPVLIFLEPGRLQIPDSAESVALLRTNIEQSVRDGMRATLQTGNLLTGRQLISFDFYPEETTAEMGQFEQYTTLPTIDTGLNRLQTQASNLLKKLNALPLQDTIAGANKAIANVDNALASLTTALDSANAMLNSAGTQALPGELVATLQQMRIVLDGFSQNAELYKNLNASLRSLDETLENTKILSRQLSDKPNALLLPARTEPDPIPKANRR